MMPLKDVFVAVERARDSGNNDRAITLLESALVEWPNVPLLWLYLAATCRDARQYERSALAAREALKLVPSDSDDLFGTAYCELGRTYYMWFLDSANVGLLESSKEHFARSLGASLDKPIRDARYVFLAIVERRLGHVEKAIALYREALSVNPRNEEAMFNLGMILHDSDPTESESLLRRALELDPAYPEAAIELARVVVSRGETEEAISVLRRVLEQHPDEIRVGMWLADLLEETNPDEAIRLLRHVLVVDPDRARAYRDLASLLLDKGDHEEAERLLMRSLDLNSQSCRSHCLLARVYLLQGRYGESEKTCLQAVHLKPERASAYWALGELFREMGDNEKAQGPFRRAFELEPDEPLCVHSLAECLIEQGRFAEGRDLLVRLRQLDPDYEAESVQSLLKACDDAGAGG